MARVRQVVGQHVIAVLCCDTSGARTQAELAQATHAATTGKAVVSIIDEVNQQLEAIVGNAKRCLELLDEDKPEIANFREPLKNIANHGHNALDIIRQVRQD